MFRSINTPIVPACASWWPMTIIWCAKASSSCYRGVRWNTWCRWSPRPPARSVLTQLNAHEIDLLVLDLGMPGITGSRWIRALRDAHPDLHIIVMTANQDSHTRDAVLAAGVEAYLLKQGETQTLLDAVNALALKRAMPAAPPRPAKRCLSRPPRRRNR